MGGVGLEGVGVRCRDGVQWGWEEGEVMIGGARVGRSERERERRPPSVAESVSLSWSPTRRRTLFRQCMPLRAGPDLGWSQSRRGLVGRSAGS